MRYEILPPVKEKKAPVGRFEILPPVEQKNESIKPAEVPGQNRFFPDPELGFGNLALQQMDLPKSPPQPQNKLISRALSLPAQMSSPEAGEAAFNYFQKLPEPPPKEQEDASRQVTQGAIGGLYGAAGAGALGPVAQAATVPDMINFVTSSGAKNSYEDIVRDHGLQDTPELRETYERSVDSMSKMTPTIFNAISAIDKITGLPLEAKTKLQQDVLQQSMLAGGLFALGEKSVPVNQNKTSPSPGSPPPPPSSDIVKGIPPQTQFAHGEEISKVLSGREPQFEIQAQSPQQVGNQTISKTKGLSQNIPKGERPQQAQNRTVSVPQDGEARDVGYRPADPAPRDLRNTIDRLITPNEETQKADLGFQFKSKLNERIRTLYDESVQPAYAESDRFLEHAIGLDEELANDMDVIINRITQKDPLRRSPAENELMRQATGIRNSVRRAVEAEAGVEGAAEAAEAVEELVPVNALDLSRQVQELNRIQSFKVEQAGDPYAMLNELRDPLESSIDRLLRGAEGVEEGERSLGIEARQNARDTYRGFKEIAEDKNIAELRRQNNLDYNQIHDLVSKDLDSFTAFQRAMTLYQDREGWDLSQLAKKELVNKHLGKYIENPRLARGRQFHEELRDLDYILAPHESASIREAFENERRQITRNPLLNRKVSKNKAEKQSQPSQPKKISLPFENMTNEQLYKHGETITGYRELKGELLKTKGGKEIVDKMSDAFAYEKMFGGEEPSYDAMRKALGNRHKKEFLVETLGAKQVENLEVAIRTLDHFAEEYSKLSPKQQIRWKKAAKDIVSFKTIKAVLSSLSKTSITPISSRLGEVLVDSWGNAEEVQLFSKEIREAIKQVRNQTKD